jgi:hypothetical protein
MKYFVRHIRIQSFPHKTNYDRKPCSLLATTGYSDLWYIEDNYVFMKDSIEKIFTSTDSNYFPVGDTESAFELFKYTDRFIETEAVCVSFDQLIEQTKIQNLTYHKREQVDNTLCSLKYCEDEPNAFLGHDKRPNNKYEYFTQHRRSSNSACTIKHNIVIGLYNLHDGVYKFVKHSMYDRSKQIYYVCEDC